jgi:hypothetical protein
MELHDKHVNLQGFQQSHIIVFTTQIQIRDLIVAGIVMTIIPI